MAGKVILCFLLTDEMHGSKPGWAMGRVIVADGYLSRE